MPKPSDTLDDPTSTSSQALESIRTDPLVETPSGQSLTSSPSLTSITEPRLPPVRVAPVVPVKAQSVLPGRIISILIGAIAGLAVLRLMFR